MRVAWTALSVVSVCPACRAFRVLRVSISVWERSFRSILPSAAHLLASAYRHNGGETSRPVDGKEALSSISKTEEESDEEKRAALNADIDPILAQITEILGLNLEEGK